MKQSLDFEFPEDMNEEDLQKFMNEINSFTVPVPSEKEINITIDNLISLMPPRRKKIGDNKIFGLLRIASNEIGFMSGTYWLISFGIFILGIYSILKNEGSIIKNSSPYVSAALMSPIPFILSFIEIFKGREEGVAELELSCKISIGEIMISRLIIICIYNIILNTMVCTALVYSNSGIMFWRATLMWLTPFTLASGIGLILVSRMRGSYVTVIFTGAWMVLVMGALSDERITGYITRVNLVVYGILSLIGIILMAVQIIHYARRQSSFYERSVLGEAKN
jgi:hypothetical protein